MPDRRTTTMSDLQARYAASLMNTFGPPKLVLARGKGAHVWDDEGNEYVDFLGGIAVNTLGHDHPALVEAVTTQLRTLAHVSNFFTTEPQVALAEKLLEITAPSPVEVRAQRASKPAESRPGKVFFANSGAEANEAAIKLTRLTGRTHLVAMEEAFHGRTLGSLALTSKEAYRAPFEPLPGHVTWVPFADVDALAAAVTDETAAVVIEPLQGEAGVNVAPTEFLAAAREITESHGALLWFDEVQSGMGRTGTWLASHPSGVAADIVTLAKGLGGGLPIGACLGFGRAATLFEPGHHGTTFGGNPLSCAAALAVIDTIERDGLLTRATEVGERLRTELATDERVVDVRGVGVLVGLTLSKPHGPDVVAAAQAAGFIVNATGPERVRLAPPLVVTDADVDALLAAWPGILDTAYQAES
jgi:acetylornithine/N-succinyldiaminopimelate aminotransferase